MSVFGRFILFIFFALMLSLKGYASDLFSQRSDTFISQKEPNKEFSKSPILKISSKKGDKSIAYLTFHVDLNELGYQPERDEIMYATLVLRFKKESQKTDNTSSIETSTKQSNKSIIQKLDDETKSEFKIYAVTDTETFLPNTQESIVSWNGKKNAPAPKHNNIDDELYDDGIYCVGEFAIDFTQDSYEDFDEIEILSDSLATFLNFAFGTTKAQNKNMQFRSPLDKLERFCLIIKQTSGKNPLHIYSANFDVNAKPESGDDASKDKKNTSQTSSEKQSTEQSQTLLSSSESNIPLPAQKESDSDSDESEENKPPPDYRPKINFEFRGSQ